MSKDTQKISDIMRSDVKTVDRNDKLSLADSVMKESGIRHLPVLDRDGLLCGVLTQRDIFRGMLLRSLGYGSHLVDKMLENHVVKEAMVDSLVTVTADTSVADAAALIVEHKVGCLPVVDGKKLVGIVTEQDFLSLVSAE